MKRWTAAALACAGLVTGAQAEPAAKAAEAPVTRAHAAEARSAADPEQIEPYKPLIRKRIKGVNVSAPIWLKASGRAFGAAPVAPGGGQFSADPALDPQIRAGLVLDSEQFYSPLVFKAELEADLVSGVALGGFDPSPAQAADYVNAPHERGLDDVMIRKAYGRVSLGPILTVSGGLMTSHWGLGLLANDGAHDWTPGSAYFGDPRRGDRVLRGVVASGPWTDAGLVGYVAYDVVQDDDILTAPGDEATQIIAALTAGHDQPSQIGAYYVYRDQRARNGAKTLIHALDVYGKYARKLGRFSFQTELEAALILGTTELAPSLDFAVHDVRQLGVASRTRLDAGAFGAVLDMVWATGDQNFDDNQQNAFKADPNFELGLVAFRHLMAAQSARAPARAGDLELVGRANPDLDRFPTAGSVSNTLAFFPRGWWRPVAGLEIYGGPLLALAEVPPADPRNSRLGGGQPRNALGGVPGSYLGTELDLGVRYRTVFRGSELMVGVEAGVFLPGSALEDEAGALPGALPGGRAMLRYRL